MVDIETLGTKPSSTILSIGAVFFDIETGELGERFYMNIDPKQDRSIDPSTVMWWMVQSSEARNSLVDTLQTRV
jgi:DNA polymerase III epsilon subunit-like protein